jgi:hypothetical protein
MQTQEIALLNKFGIAKGNNFSYSESVNAFIGNGYISMAGNTYLNEIRFMEGIVIKEDVGQGYSRTFVNGIRLFDLQSKTLLCERNYHCTFYSQFHIKTEVKDMLTNLLNEAARKENISFSSSDIKNHIERLVDKAFSEDQRKMIINQSQKYLSL